ncbi:MAG: HAD family hydrolase [Pseudomonadota bacterium]
MSFRWRGRLGRREGVVHTDFRQYLADLSAAAGVGQAVAFFDLDRTVIAGYSVAALAWERMRSGYVPLRHLLSSAGAFLGYGLGRNDYHELLTTTIRDLAGESEDTLVQLGERAFRSRVQGWIYAEARHLVNSHRSLGHHVVILTSATRFQAAPIARELDVDALSCTEVEVSEGCVTGKALPCFGAGKRAMAERLLDDCGAELRDAYFYSDSSDDLPLLEAVGRPVVVNPKPAMARLAAARGWPCLVFESPTMNGTAA